MTGQARIWVRAVFVVLVLGLVVGFTAGKYLSDNNLAKSTTTKREENVSLLSFEQVGALLLGLRPSAGVIMCLALIDEHQCVVCVVRA